MSLYSKSNLLEIAKVICRDLRKNSTKAERLLWEELRNRKLDSKKFLRQYPIFYDLNGKESFFIVDFYCHKEKIAIEVDGEHHSYRLDEDLERTNVLNHMGIRVLRFSNEIVINNLTHVLNNIRNNFKNY